MRRVDVDRSRFNLAIVLSFVLWGSGRLLLKRRRADLLALFLHVYIYFLFWLSEYWLLWFPVSALGGAYFVLDLGKSFRPQRDKEK